MPRFYGPTVSSDPVEAERRRRVNVAMADLSRHPNDHVSGRIKGADPESAALHERVIGYIRKVEARGRKISYRAALEAITRKPGVRG